jgi:hypothetical protein
MVKKSPVYDVLNGQILRDEKHIADVPSDGSKIIPVAGFERLKGRAQVAYNKWLKGNSEKPAVVKATSVSADLLQAERKAKHEEVLNHPFAPRRKKVSKNLKSVKVIHPIPEGAPTDLVGGDRDPRFVEFLCKNHPELAKSRYDGRNQTNPITNEII